MPSPILRFLAIFVLLLSVAAAAEAASPGPQARHQLGEAELPELVIGVAFSYPFESRITDPEPEFSITSGQLPDGVTLSRGGLLSGTVTVPGTSTFVVTASNGVAEDESQEFTLQAVGTPVLHVDPAAGIAETAANLTGTIDPRNLPASAWFEYWPANTPQPPVKTTVVAVPKGVGPVALANRIEGLQPARDYQFRLAATDDLTFEPVHSATLSLHTAGLPPPVAGESFNLDPVEGTTSTKCPGEQDFSKLAAPKQVTLDCEVDTTHGTVSLTASKGSSGQTQTAQFWGGQFDLDQKAGDDKPAVLGLAGGKRCEKRKSGKHRRVQERARGGSGGRKLWGSGSGNYKTVGSHGAATVRGTIWLVSDHCDGSTHFKVKKGVVAVRDFVKHKTVTLEAGESYVAKVVGARLP